MGRKDGSYGAPFAAGELGVRIKNVAWAEVNFLPIIFIHLSYGPEIGRGAVFFFWGGSWVPT